MVREIKSRSRDDLHFSDLIDIPSPTLLLSDCVNPRYPKWASSEAISKGARSGGCPSCFVAVQDN